MPRPCDRMIEVRRLEHVAVVERVEALGLQPAAQYLDHPCPERRAFITPPLKSTWVGHASPLGPRRTGSHSAALPPAASGTAQDAGSPQDRRRTANPAPEGRPVAAGQACRAPSLREEPFTKHLVDILARQRCGHRAADQPRPAPEQCHRPLVWVGSARRASLARRHWCHSPCRCQVSMHGLRPRAVAAARARARGPCCRRRAGCVRPRRPAQREISVRLRHRNQAEVGGAAADVAHQNQIADARSGAASCRPCASSQA